jgi:DNA-binding TFAR19-related protein (PDSD5 family)
MSDAELQAIRRRKIKELQRNLVNRQTEEPNTVNPDAVLNQIFRERAWEVFNTASQKYPQVMMQVKRVLVQLAQSGRLKEITGEQLYYFLRSIGLRVRLKTSISFAKHGKFKSLSEKIKDDLKL